MNELEPRVPLEELDPGHRDPGYWARFHRSVMSAAGPGLARRAAAAAPTLEDILASWSRMFVPGAIAVAAVAGLLLVADVESDPLIALTGVEDLLVPEWTDEDPEPLPAVFFEEDDLDAVLFAANPF